jgi:hypothetical protein
MRVDRMQTNGVLNWVAHVYSYFEPPTWLTVTATTPEGDPAPYTVFEITGPHGFAMTAETDGYGVLALEYIDLGRYLLSDAAGDVHIADVWLDGLDKRVVVR